MTSKNCWVAIILIVIIIVIYKQLFVMSACRHLICYGLTGQQMFVGKKNV